jgi:hypothetical protein
MHVLVVNSLPSSHLLHSDITYVKAEDMTTSFLTVIYTDVVAVSAGKGFADSA